MKYALIITIILNAGCVYSLRPHIPAFDRTFRLHAADPTAYSVRVEGETTQKFQVLANGNVHINVPESPRACDRRVFGINLGGSGWPRIYLLKGNRKIKELSPMDLFDTAPNKQGVYELHIQ
jgi:hypothetical protein